MHWGARVIDSGSNMTTEGIEVKPGQTWRDLDRLGEHIRVVISVEDGKALMVTKKPGGVVHPTRVAINRMHRRTVGWELVAESE